jgi:hypothetical protein
MEPLIKQKSKKTPAVKFQNGLIELEGRSTTNDPLTFYKPLQEWVNHYANHPEEFTAINIRLEYFDTASSKYLLDLLKTMDIGFKKGHKMVVNWYYELGDDDMHDIGIYFESFVKIPFKFLEFRENTEISE